jgi:hypothetical protein
MPLKILTAIVKADTIFCPDVAEKGGGTSEPVSLLTNIVHAAST